MPQTLKFRSVLFKLIFAFLIVRFTSGQIPFKGKCANKNPLHPVDIRKFSGVWYESERSSSLAQWPYKCITFKIQPFFEHKSSLSITAIHRFSGKLETHKTSLSVKSEDAQDGKLVANITQDGLHEPKETPIQILASDNSTKHWAIVWSCVDFETGPIHTEMLWIFTRQRFIDEKVYAEIREGIVALNLEHYVTRETLHNTCSKEDELTEDED